MNSFKDKHLIELPRKILVGYNTIESLGEFIHDFGFGQKILIISGFHVNAIISSKINKLLRKSNFNYTWQLINSATIENVNYIVKVAKKKKVDLLIGLGGGKSVDVAKLSASKMNLPFISIPTSASHDGICSPFTSLKGLQKPYSITAMPPVGILADITQIANAPKRLLASGCGDLIAKITAIKDWELAKNDVGEYFAKYAASLAHLSAKLILEESDKIGKEKKESIRDVVEALISAGVAAGIAGTSRPCSGSEHLFSHALDVLAPEIGFHGEKCGLGTIIMAKLHDLNWKDISISLKNVNAPTSAYELGIDPKIIVDAILLAPRLRPERYTILHKKKLDRDAAINLAKSVRVI